jgi:hypothetical protein
MGWVPVSSIPFALAYIHMKYPAILSIYLKIINGPMHVWQFWITINAKNLTHHSLLGCFLGSCLSDKESPARKIRDLGRVDYIAVARTQLQNACGPS